MWLMTLAMSCSMTSTSFCTFYISSTSCLPLIHCTNHLLSTSYSPYYILPRVYSSIYILSISSSSYIQYHLPTVYFLLSLSSSPESLRVLTLPPVLSLRHFHIVSWFLTDSYSKSPISVLSSIPYINTSLSLSLICLLTSPRSPIPAMPPIDPPCSVFYQSTVSFFCFLQSHLNSLSFRSDPISFHPGGIALKESNVEWNDRPWRVPM